MPQSRFKYKNDHQLVVIGYKDHEAEVGWIEPEDDNDFLPFCLSVGWLRKETNDMLKIASSISFDEDGSLKGWGEQNKLIKGKQVIQFIKKLNLRL